MKELPLIFKNILHNKAIWILTILQVALTLAVLVNSYASIHGYGKMIDDSMGIVQDRLVAIDLELPDISTVNDTNPQQQQAGFKDRIQQTVQTILRQPDVETVSHTNGFPISNEALTRRAKLKHEDEIGVGITLYTADQDFLNTLGVSITAGRAFAKNEVLWTDAADNIEDIQPIIIVSSELAERLFPAQNPLQKSVSIDGRYFSIVGVAERLPGLHPLWSNVELSAYMPGQVATAKNKLLVQLRPEADMNRSLAQLDLALNDQGTAKAQFVSILPLTELKAATLVTASATLKVLGFITILLLVVSALGVYGQTSFNVARKTKETGIKRALGATKLDIFSYYLIENWLVTSIGAALGLGFAILLNYALVQGLGATKISFGFVVPGILFLWLVGLAATFFPARRAANIPPVHATRAI